MEFKYAMSILFSNMGYVFKILLWIVLCVLLVAAVSAAIFIPIANVLVETTDVMTYINAIASDASGFIDGTVSIRALLTGIYQNSIDVLGAISANAGASVGLVFAFIFVYMLYMFLTGLSYYPMADIINNLMSSNLRFGFASNMALNFKNACKYSGAKVLVAFPIDLVILGIAVGVGYGLISAIGVFALPIVLVLIILLCSLRAVFFSGWLPRMLFHPEERVFTNLSRSFTFVKTNIKGFFKAYVITFSLAYMMTSAFSVPTFGLISVIVPSVYYFLLRTVELIGYYKVKGLCFYTDASTVVNTVEFGYRKANQKEDDSAFEYPVPEKESRAYTETDESTNKEELGTKK